MFKALETWWDSDECWIQEFSSSGLENCRILLETNEKILAKLSEPGITPEAYRLWVNDLQGWEMITERRLARIVLDSIRDGCIKKIRCLKIALTR